MKSGAALAVLLVLLTATARADDGYEDEETRTVSRPEELWKPDGVHRVVNGCGPESLKLFSTFNSHRFADTHTYTFGVDRGEYAHYTVDFHESCNLHDIGYQGQYFAWTGTRWVAQPLVYDKILNQNIDYSNAARAWIDQHFLEDMRAECVQQIDRAIRERRPGADPRGRDRAIGYCFDGYNVTWGAATLYTTVRSLGHGAFSNENEYRINDRGE